MFKKIFLFVFLSLFFSFFLQVPDVFAQKNFRSELSSSYEIYENGKAIVNLKFKLTNLQTDLYASSYSIFLSSTDPKEIFVKDRGGINIPFSSTKDQDKTSVNVNFDNPVLGKDNSQEFILTYTSYEFAHKNGDIWEVTIPKIDVSHFDYFDVSMSVPGNFEVAYMSPNPVSVSSVSNRNIYKFNSDLASRQGIFSTFGKFQVFTFSINYHLYNPLKKKARTSIALPPDTAYQRMYYSKIDPVPSNMYVDEDGNWIAEYEISPQENIDVKTNGSVQIFPSAIKKELLTSEQRKRYLEPKEYWESNDPQIVEIASKLKTPRDIYDYVVKSLKYDFTKISNPTKRLGAKTILSSTDKALCTEFTDLFIAISRASGIPAREINGYGYTENPGREPLSLVEDVLHAWPEYFDDEKQLWISVDPTWGNTTGGVDFFSNFDLRHFAFVTHGIDSKYPYPAGSYKSGTVPQKDIQIIFGKLPENKNEVDVEVGYETKFPVFGEYYLVKIKNNTNTAIYNWEYQIDIDSDKFKTEKISTLLPFQSILIKERIPVGINNFWKLPKSISILYSDNRIVSNTPLNKLLFHLFIVGFVPVVLLIIFLYLKLRKNK